MRITCTTENLKKALTTVSHIVGKNQNLPILNNVLIQAEEGLITLATTNLELGIKTHVRGKVEQAGSATVPVKLLTDYISNVSADAVVLQLKEFNIHITAKKSRTTIKGVDATEFPLLPEIEAEQSFEIPLLQLKKALQQTVFASSHDTTRPELCNVLVKTKNNKLLFVATDSYRLAEKTISTAVTAELVLLIPQGTLQEVSRIFDDTEENLTIEVNDNQIKFSNSNTFLISRIAEGQFPDYEQIIPDNNKTAVVLPVAEFAKGVRAASIFCRQGINDVKLLFDTKGVTISAVNDQVGESEVVVNCEVAGSENSVVFNYYYLLDVLSVVDTTEIQFEVSDSMLPGLIRPHGSDDYVYVIMPIKQ